MRPNRPNNNPRPRGHARAHAPYNFIPLPDAAIPAEMMSDEAGNLRLPRHDIYLNERKSGHFEVTLTTVTPLYIRGMLSVEETRENNKKMQEGKKDTQSIQPEPFHVGGVPRLPGSSLRGMLRTLLEIVTFSKIQPVSDRYKFFFRAVAADKNDPLRDPYRKMIGAFSRHVQAGYLIRWGEQWQIRPAERFGSDPFAKVKDRPQIVGDVRDLKRFNDPAYNLQVHPVHYEETHSRIQRVYSPPNGEQPMGILVCSGNMLETQSTDGTESPRKNYTLVMPPARNRQPISIPDTVVRDYRDALTPFVRDQHKAQFNSEDGVLVEHSPSPYGHPVFYIEERGQVIAFGHTPNFRVPHLVWQDDKPLAVTLHDVIPPELHKPQQVVYDYAEALFGFVADEDDDRGSYAGRISVTSAELEAHWRAQFETNPGVVLEREFTPSILASPKPTTFQHYLEQQHPHKLDLKHYGSTGAKLRGHKLYWRKQIGHIKEIEQTDTQELESKKTQYTRIQPVKTGVSFTFRVCFDNLTDSELGALAWVLTLDDDPKARHMLGMGKPYGLGVVQLSAKLYLIDRAERYTQLFSAGSWATGQSEHNPETYIKAFKSMIAAQTGKAFDSHPRIKELQTLLRLVAPSATYDYMTIEPNEFKERPVLPYPSKV